MTDDYSYKHLGAGFFYVRGFYNEWIDLSATWSGKTLWFARMTVFGRSLVFCPAYKEAL